MIIEENIIYSQDCRYGINFDQSDGNCEEQAKAVAIALNNHDELVEMLTEFNLLNLNYKDYNGSDLQAKVNKLLKKLKLLKL